MMTRLVVRDLQSAQAVYGAVGLTLDVAERMVLGPDMEPLAGLEVDPAAEHEGWHVGLAVLDVLAAHSALLAAGAQEVAPVTSAPDGSVHSGVQRVPGEVLGLYQPPPLR